MVMEAEKFHSLYPMNWRTKNTGGIIKSKRKGLRIGCKWYKYRSQSKSPRSSSASV